MRRGRRSPHLDDGDHVLRLGEADEREEQVTRHELPHQLLRHGLVARHVEEHRVVAGVVGRDEGPVVHVSAPTSGRERLVRVDGVAHVPAVRDVREAEREQRRLRVEASPLLALEHEQPHRARLGQRLAQRPGRHIKRQRQPKGTKRWRHECHGAARRPLRLVALARRGAALSCLPRRRRWRRERGGRGGGGGRRLRLRLRLPRRCLLYTSPSPRA